jgi:hypothetical protein
MDIAENRAPRPSVLYAARRAPRGPGRLRRRVAGRSLLALRFALLASALAFAPPAAASETEGDAAPVVFAARELIPDGTAVRVLGRDVRGPSGQVVAQVVNVLVDGSGRPLAAVLDYGGFMGVGKRRVAVAWRALSFAPGGTPGSSGIALGLSRDQLKGFPDHKDGEPIVVAAPPAPDPAAPPATGGPAPGAVVPR